MDYTWTQQKSFDEHAMLSYLPMKMRTDIAMRVHYSTLGKVKLFKNCEPGLLKDLVVLLRPIIYLPGDYICRKNDIGKEMFIIQSGQVQVGGIHKLHEQDFGLFLHPLPHCEQFYYITFSRLSPLDSVYLRSL